MSSPMPAKPQISPIPVVPGEDCSPNKANRTWAAPPPIAQPNEIMAMPIIKGTDRM